MTKNKLNHLAIIMDGNARWAQANQKNKFEGHKKGAENAKMIVQAALELGIPNLTLYAFSSENWGRSKLEVSGLIKLLRLYLLEEAQEYSKYSIRVKVIGEFSKLDKSLKTKIDEVVKLTENSNKMTLYVAFGYGSRAEIANACQKSLDLGIGNIDEENFHKLLYAPEMPDVDLMIRTGDRYRISNFLLWQSAYAELYFSKKNWPDFNKSDLISAIEDYDKRERNFGKR